MQRDIAALLARMFLSAVFIPNGWLKLTNIAGTAAYFEGLGLPAPSVAAWGCAVFELLAGTCVLIGLQTRIAAFLVAGFCLVAGWLGHFGQGGEDAALAFSHFQSLLKDIGLAGGFLALMIAGAGRISLDGFFARK